MMFREPFDTQWMRNRVKLRADVNYPALLGRGL